MSPTSPHAHHQLLNHAHHQHQHHSHNHNHSHSHNHDHNHNLSLSHNLNHSLSHSHSHSHSQNHNHNHNHSLNHSHHLNSSSSNSSTPNLGHSQTNNNNNSTSSQNNNNKAFYIENLLKSNGSQRKQRKARTAFTDHQLKELEASFEAKRYLNVQDRVELAAKLNLSDTQVKTWYQNRRTKQKRQHAVGIELLNEQNYLTAYQSVLQQSSAQWLLSQCGNQGAQIAAAFQAAAFQAMTATNTNGAPPTTSNNLAAAATIDSNNSNIHLSLQNQYNIFKQHHQQNQNQGQVSPDRVKFDD